MNTVNVLEGRLLGPFLDRPAKPELTAQGWERRFVTDGRRLKEYAALYDSLGFDVRVEPILPEETSPDCSDCRLIMALQFHTLYTRRRSSIAA